MTLRPAPRSCERCGHSPLVPQTRVKNQRHPLYGCRGCGFSLDDAEARQAKERAWIAAGRPWLGTC